jgi:prolyl-tRNA editing enzyme YbaK/EbsC (Cys-tRNA(Pro) deacylase)
MEASTQSEARGIEAVVRYLNEHGVAHEVVDHEATFSASEEARAAGVAPDHAAKTVVLREGDAYRLAVLPASERLDVGKARDALDAGSHLRLATETEMEEDFGAFEVGALPPLGPMLPAPEVIDRRLIQHDRILCSGGDHRHSVLLDSNELARDTGATVADICED